MFGLFIAFFMVAIVNRRKKSISIGRRSEAGAEINKLIPFVRWLLSMISTGFREVLSWLDWKSINVLLGELGLYNYELRARQTKPY